MPSSQCRVLPPAVPLVHQVNMAAAGEWELVKNSRKKGSSVPNGKLSKEEKKNFIEKAPRVTATGGVHGVGLEIWQLICGLSHRETTVVR